MLGVLGHIGISSDHFFFHAVIENGVPGKSKGIASTVESVVTVLPHIPSGQKELIDHCSCPP